MDWVKRMNEAIDELEARLLEPVDYAALARRAGTSAYHFQRMFSYMAGVSLGEYIRRRRLTLAASELRDGRMKVIDAAMKYGYESPESFARAFRLQHGIPPSAADRAGTRLKAYPKISFHMAIKVQRYDVKSLIRENWKFSWLYQLGVLKKGRIKLDPVEIRVKYQILTGN